MHDIYLQHYSISKNVTRAPLNPLIYEYMMRLFIVWHHFTVCRICMYIEIYFGPMEIDYVTLTI
jgi:hypothetical protein